MKVITIGRGEENQIVLDDNQDMISRQHATLRIHETGKMEIVSTGTNGTFVNGFRIKSNVPHKVTRKDVVSFAHVRQLDWALVPDPFRFVRFGIIGVVVIALVTIAIVLLWPEKKKDQVVPVYTPGVMNTQMPGEGIPSGKTPEKETPKEQPAEAGKETDIKMKKFPSLKNKEKESEEKAKPEEETKPEDKSEETIIPIV